MSLVFAATFFMLWSHRRDQRHVLILSAGYLAFASGFYFQFFEEPFGFTLSRIISNGSFLVGVVLTGRGCLERYGIAAPMGIISALAAAGMAVFTYFLLVQPDLTWRIFTMNFTFGAIILIVGLNVARVPDPKLIDRLLAGILLLWGVMFFPRPIMLALIEGPYVDPAAFHDTLYWITMTLSGSLFLLISALTLILGMAFELIDELRKQSITDPLSGLLNRRGFEARAGELLERHAGTPFALVVADLDHFKAVNDTLGHATGDTLISLFGARIRAAAGPDAVAGRIGGEEFAVLLPASDAGAARLFAEGVRIAYGQAAGTSVALGHVSASFGVAGSQPGESLSSLLLRADGALYAAKQDGRDCVRVAAAPGGTTAGLLSASG